METPISEKTQETLNPSDLILKTLDRSQLTLSRLAEFAVKNGALPELASNIKGICQPDAYDLLPRADIKKLLVQTGTDPDRADLVIAITHISGDVLIAEEDAENDHTVIHESIHRAANLAERARGNPRLAEELATLYDLRLTPDDEIDPTSIVTGTDSIETRTMFLKQIYKQVREGLAEWSTQFCNEVNKDGKESVVINVADFKYPDQVKGFEDIRRTLVAQGFTKEHASALLIEAALTNDIIKIEEALGRYELVIRINEMYYTSHMIWIWIIQFLI